MKTCMSIIVAVLLCTCSGCSQMNTRIGRPVDVLGTWAFAGRWGLGNIWASACLPWPRHFDWRRLSSLLSSGLWSCYLWLASCSNYCRPRQAEFSSCPCRRGTTSVGLPGLFRLLAGFMPWRCSCLLAANTNGRTANDVRAVLISSSHLASTPSCPSPLRLVSLLPTLLNPRRPSRPERSRPPSSAEPVGRQPNRPVGASQG